MNLKLMALALLALLCIGVSNAYAQPTYPGTTVPTTPDCRIDCGGGGGDGGFDAGEPFCPFDHCGRPDPEPDPDPHAECELRDCDPTRPDPECQVNCGPGSGGNIPGNKVGLQLCDAQIGDLKKVTARQIKGVNSRDAVQIVPVCVDKNLIEQQQGVENIRSAIAQNDRMDAALGRNGYGADDVVGVVVDRTQAVLYVHAL